MERIGKIYVEREVPELVRAVSVVRAGWGIEVRVERMVYEVGRVVAGGLFVAWGIGCAALAAFAGAAGSIVASAIVLANAALVRLMARHAPEIFPDDREDDVDALGEIPNGLARMAVIALSLTVFLPSVAIGFRWHADASLRKLDEKRTKADAVANDPRWSALRRLFLAIERQNEIAAAGIAVGEPAAILEPLLEEARANTYLRPLGRAHKPLSATFLRGLDRLESSMAKLSLERDRLRDRVV